jgi:hypothetical protein
MRIQRMPNWGRFYAVPGVEMQVLAFSDPSHPFHRSNSEGEEILVCGESIQRGWQVLPTSPTLSRDGADSQGNG